MVSESVEGLDVGNDVFHCRFIRQGCDGGPHLRALGVAGNRSANTFFEFLELRELIPIAGFHKIGSSLIFLPFRAFAMTSGARLI